MNFALPGIFISLGIDSVDNFDFPVSLSTATLGLSPHQTEVLTGRHTRGGRESVFKHNIPVFGLVLLALLPRTRLLPPSERDAVAVHQLPVVGTSGLAIAETGEVPRVGVGHGQP